MFFPTRQTLIPIEGSRTPTGNEAPAAPSRWGRGAMAVAQELIAAGDPVRRETRCRIALLTFAVFAALC